MGRDGTAPRIAGQSREYLTATFAGYASGQRSSGFMQPIAAPLSTDEIAALAAHYADMRPDAPAPAGGEAPTPDSETQRDLRALGARLAAEGDTTRFLPGCNSCHEGTGAVRPRVEYPRIAGQDSRFITAWLQLYRDRPAGGTDFANVMHVAATGLTDHHIEALAAWYSSLPFDGGAGNGAETKPQAAAGAPG